MRGVAAVGVAASLLAAHPPPTAALCRTAVSDLSRRPDVMTLLCCVMLAGLWRPRPSAAQARRALEKVSEKSLMNCMMIGVVGWVRGLCGPVNAMSKGFP